MILGVKENADLEEIKRAYKRLCKAYHPDEGAEDDTMFKKLREIYVTLNDPQKKLSMTEKERLIRLPEAEPKTKHFIQKNRKARCVKDYTEKRKN